MDALEMIAEQKRQARVLRLWAVVMLCGVRDCGGRGDDDGRPSGGPVA
jgi:hypothetical protein